MRSGQSLLLFTALATANGFSLASAGAASIKPRAPPPLNVLPSVSTVAVACIAPTCLGFWKSGYAVSYAYGGAMAAAAYITLPHATGLGAAHAAALLFYGARLNIFLLYRELALDSSIHQMVNRPADLAARLKRAPVVLGCAFLYFCMLAPLRVSVATGAAFAGPAAWAVKVAFAGFGLAALGDTVKSIVKARDGKDALVTVFPLNVLRHPNYTGECIGWAASFAAAVLAAASAGAVRAQAVWLGLSALGTVGIFFVLAGAASSLEKKQAERYKSSPEYAKWVASSWAGPVMKAAEGL
jgi:steroid 5-alpha reductase family enzyme